MENCVYQGDVICTFDLKDENGIYYEDMVLDWKQAASNRLLTCMECGANVYLAAGPIKEPYFSHYDVMECNYGSGHETEEHKKGKRLLYHMLKRSFPDAQVWARFRMDNGMYSTLYCEASGGIKLAVDYRLQNNSLDKFQMRESFYQSKQIVPIYVLGIRMEKDIAQIDWYQHLLQSAMGYLVFLDVEKEQLTLKKSFGYRLGNERKFKYCEKTYPLRELTVSKDGQMVCDFSEECMKVEAWIRNEKQQYTQRKERLRLLQEEKQRLEAAEQQRLEEYRRRRLEEENQDKYSTKDGRNDDQNGVRIEESYVVQAFKPDNKEERDYIESLGLNYSIYQKCKQMIKEGNAHLVAKKYYDAFYNRMI
ncbi:hypothetical protein H0486_06600 [Lachnospiraceae bacterium MD1]|uniref:Competence protein CoiA nuclease-like domain-containing protein n=1 Tax=Variimorphobacter saccharofermentans TaxID=2755051 RepID=A0A839JYP4_9FIRM|nr:competence protein CoiA family protein [Variimorphobacter saccharofermentans]MBB2182540.1 hypothetical protein [Variimorphobacter saccharofermentans]